MTVSHLRSWFWRYLARYSYELCDRCGRRVSPAKGREPLTYWQAPADLWRAVHGPHEGVCCPSCFTRDARRKGIFIHWEAVSDA